MSHTAAAEAIAAAAPGFTPAIGMLLGSGLAAVADAVEPVVDLAYDGIPGFPDLGVAGHKASLRLGHLAGVPVAVLQGRKHGYEAGVDGMAVPIRALKAVGCRTMVLTAAVGGISPAIPVGQIVLVTDHLNLTGASALHGPNDETVGPRFVAMNQPYDPAARKALRAGAAAAGVSLTQGVYAGMRGPQFESPAEMRMLRSFGADVVGMSVVNECLLAKHCGLAVAAMAIVVNGPPDAEVDDVVDPHLDTLRAAKEAAPHLASLMAAAAPALAEAA